MSIHPFKRHNTTECQLLHLGTYRHGTQPTVYSVNRTSETSTWDQPPLGSNRRNKSRHCISTTELALWPLLDPVCTHHLNQDGLVCKHYYWTPQCPIRWLIVPTLKPNTFLLLNTACQSTNQTQFLVADRFKYIVHNYNRHNSIKVHNYCCSASEQCLRLKSTPVHLYYSELKAYTKAERTVMDASLRGCD